MSASHLFSNKKNSKDPQHMNFGKRTGAGPWWALPWALGPPLGPGGALRGSGPARALGPSGALRGSGPARALGPSGAFPWALPWALGRPLGIAGIGPWWGFSKYVRTYIFNTQRHLLCHSE